MRNLNVVKSILKLAILSTFTVSNIWAATLPDRANTESIEFNNMTLTIGGNANKRRASNDIWMQTDRRNWKRIVDKPGFSHRYGHDIYIQDRKIWVHGGKDKHHTNLHDTWYSNDGKHWKEYHEKSTTSTNDRDLPHRANRDHIEFNGDWFAIGGNADASKASNDIWISTDRVHWEKIVDEPGFSHRYGHHIFIDNNIIWLAGGKDKHGNKLFDVWLSFDGYTWEEFHYKTTNESDETYTPHDPVEFKNGWYDVGGVYDYPTDDIWYSKDGDHWTKIQESAQFSTRYGHAVIAWNRKLWLVGGTGRGDYFNDVWSSEDGIEWKEETNDVNFSPRAFHRLRYRSGFAGAGNGQYGLELIGGEDDVTNYTDSWETQDGKNWRKVDPNIVF